LLAGVRAYGDPSISVSVVEGTVNEQPEKTVEKILATNPDVLGFCCYIWNITRVAELLPIIKQHLPKVTMVLGGPEVGYCAKEVLETYPQVDFVITGEGERALPLLCNALLTGEKLDIGGLTYREGEKIISVPELPLTEESPSPYCQEYFDALQGRIAYLETSRGCPYACAYCLSARCGKLKFYSLERAKKELLLLANSGTKTVKLVDRTFNANRQRAKDLWRFIIENYGTNIPKGVCFHFEIAGDLLDEESISLLHTVPAGLMQFEIGIQSFHSETLTYIRRKTDIEKLTRNIRRLLEKNNVHVHIDLIAGLPLEDFDTFGESVNRAFALQPHMLQLGFLKMIHGSPMREDSERYPCQFHKTPPYEVTATPVLNQQELMLLHKVEWALDKLYNSGRFGRSLPYVLSVTGMTPFAFFLAFGQWVHFSSGASLDEVAKAFYDFALAQGADKEQLRNCMVCERLETVRGGKLPAFLQVEDSRLATFRKSLRKDVATAPSKGISRGTALLYEPLQGVYVDYDIPHPVTGKYDLHIVDL
jgi:radical SAM superfamily enzyme YgiQ (UPF0313 family)